MCQSSINATCESCTRDDAICPTTTDDDQPSTCTICLQPLNIASTTNKATEPIPETAVTIKKCGHVFGRNCLEQWMRDANTCPMCRVEFFPMLETKGMEDDAQLNSGTEMPYYALGVYVDNSVLDHFRELLIGDEEDGIDYNTAIARGASERSRRIDVRQRRGPSAVNGRRVYYA